MADDSDRSGEEGDVTSEVPAGFEADPPSYRSGRVRIIGAEPAGNAVHEVTGPVVEENPDMPHWNDAPTGQVPAILDRGNGDEQALAPPSWREEDTDWAAHEELFEPSMLSDEAPPVGSMMNNNNDIVDMERQPWHFDTDDLPDDDTLVIEPDRPPETPSPRGRSRGSLRGDDSSLHDTGRSRTGRIRRCGGSRTDRVCRCGRRPRPARPGPLRPALHRPDPLPPPAPPRPDRLPPPAPPRPDRPGRYRRWLSRSSPSPRHRSMPRPGSPRPAWSPRCHRSPACGHRGRPASTRRHPTANVGGTAGATCGWPGGRASSWASWRCSAPTSAACPPWSSSPSWCSWLRPRRSPPSAPPSTTRPRCSGWWRSCR